MALDHEHAAPAVDGDSGGRDDLWLSRDPLENQPRIEHSRRRGSGPFLESQCRKDSKAKLCDNASHCDLCSQCQISQGIFRSITALL